MSNRHIEHAIEHDPSRKFAEPASSAGESPVVRPHGLWSSPISAAMIGRGMRFGDVRWTVTTRPANNGTAAESHPQLVWLEHRSGRGIIVASDGADAPTDITSELNVRARLGYGGGEFTVTTDEVFFAADGRLYRQPLTSGDPTPITPAFGQAASPTVSPDGRFVACIHSAEGNDCVAVADATGQRWPQQLVYGDDFYMQPTWSPDGRMVAFVAWNHPQMPWDGAELRIARLRVDETTPAMLPMVDAIEVIAGGAGVSVFQPEFSPDGRFLAYVSDETGWWQLYLYDLETGDRWQLTDAPCEHGQPAWVQGLRTYVFSPDGRSIYYIRNEAGFHHVWCCHFGAMIAENGGTSTPNDGASTRNDGTPHGGTSAPNDAWTNFRIPSVFDEYTVLEQIAVAPVRGSSTQVDIACIASAPDIPPRVVVARVDEGAGAPIGRRCAIRRRSRAEQFAPGLLSVPQAIQWRAEEGTPVHGLFYRPANPRYTADGSPPVIINIHGGPTSQAMPEFNLKAQFYTSRGYAFLDVNYRGSTGYGRAYREQLKGRWGIVDVEDAVAGAKHLADHGLGDGERLVILGSSAGGYTVLRALITYPGFFRAGICLYGVSDLFGLASDTHKFEERYTDSLVGPLPQAAALYRELSPVFHAERLRDPLAVFQGTDDDVVPREQSDTIVAALRARGVPYEYHVYEGEGHGWRRPETVESFYGAVEAFLRKYVVFA